MSQILSPPQRRPDLIGQCESCKTIAIFGEEEQFVDEEYEEVEPKIERNFGDKPDLVIQQPAKRVLKVTAACPGSERCATYRSRITLHSLNSNIGTYFKETAEGNPKADSNFSKRMIGEVFEPLNKMQARWESERNAIKEAKEQEKPGIVARISDAWGWFWRKE